MARVVADPLPRRRKGQGKARAGVPSQRTIQRPQTVAQQRAGEIRRAFAAHGGRGKTLDTRRQRQRLARITRPSKAIGAALVFVAQIAVAQIGNSGAADLAQARQRRQVR